MTRPRLLQSALAPLVALWLAVAAYAGTPRSLVAQVDRVSDGDTVTAVSSEGTKLRIRLLGIDAPEIPHGPKPGQPYGEEARDY
jgi:micrococcal nuclease